MANEGIARVGCHHAALIFDLLRDGKIVMLVIKVSSDSTMFILYIVLKTLARENFFCNLKL